MDILPAARAANTLRLDQE